MSYVLNTLLSGVSRPSLSPPLLRQHAGDYPDWLGIRLQVAFFTNFGIIPSPKKVGQSFSTTIFASFQLYVLRGGEFEVVTGDFSVPQSCPQKRLIGHISKNPDASSASPNENGAFAGLRIPPEKAI